MLLKLDENYFFSIQFIFKIFFFQILKEEM